MASPPFAALSPELLGHVFSFLSGSPDGLSAMRAVLAVSRGVRAAATGFLRSCQDGVTTTYEKGSRTGTKETIHLCLSFRPLELHAYRHDRCGDHANHKGMPLGLREPTTAEHRAAKVPGGQTLVMMYTFMLPVSFMLWVPVRLEIWVPGACKAAVCYLRVRYPYYAKLRQASRAGPLVIPAAMSGKSKVDPNVAVLLQLIGHYERHGDAAKERMCQAPQTVFVVKPTPELVMDAEAEGLLGMLSTRCGCPDEKLEPVRQSYSMSCAEIPSAAIAPYCCEEDPDHGYYIDPLVFELVRQQEKRR